MELAEGEEIVTALDTRSDDLCQELMDMELRNVEIVKDLVFEFDREYTEIVSKSKTIITEFFEKIRELEENYFAGLQEEAMRVYERFGSGELDDACSEDAKLLLGDKDTFMNWCSRITIFTPPPSTRWRIRRVLLFTLVPIRPRSRGERRFLIRRTFLPGVCFSPPITPRWFQSRRTATPFNSASDAFQSTPTFVALNDGPSTLISSRRKRGDGWTSSSTASGTGNEIGTACASRRSSR